MQLAQLELDAGQIDSAYVAIELAPKNGEDPATAAQFALARGNALYRSATASQKREDYQRAMRFLALATKLGPTPESKFLLGASALSISQSAATEAPATKSCDLSRLADSTLTEAEINLVSGGSAAPDAAKTCSNTSRSCDPTSRFTVCVSVNGVGEATGTGLSKQEAETAAAEALLEKLP